MLGDPLIWVLILPGMVLGGLAQSWVKSNFMKYSRVPLQQGLTGAEVARYILDAKGLRQVAIEPSLPTRRQRQSPEAQAVQCIEYVRADPVAAFEAVWALPLQAQLPSNETTALLSSDSARCTHWPAAAPVSEAVGRSNRD